MRLTACRDGQGNSLTCGILEDVIDCQLFFILCPHRLRGSLKKLSRSAHWHALGTDRMCFTQMQCNDFILELLLPKTSFRYMTYIHFGLANLPRNLREMLQLVIGAVCVSIAPLSLE